MSGGQDRAELPGLQAERTMLAWERTSFALLGNGALLLVRVAEPTSAAPLIGAAGAITLAVVTAVIGRRRARRIASLRSGSTTAPVAAVTTLAAGTVGVAALVLVTTLV